MTKTPFKQHIANLAYILKIQDIQNIVICPGSRNAPLIQVFERDPFFSCYSIVDERSAGYIALGMSKQLGKSVVVVTTSGTAALNLAPAVAEAFYQQIPIIVLTADRPAEWPPQFGNQRINQEEIFRQNSKHFFNFPVESAHKDEWIEACGSIYNYMESASKEKKGPVHFNIPLNDHLYERVTDKPTCNFTPDQLIGRKQELVSITEKEIERILDALQKQKKVLIICGMKQYAAEVKEILTELHQKFQVSVLAENISNLNSAGFINCPELVLGSVHNKDKLLLEPDLVIMFGGQVVSKQSRLFIQGLINTPVIVSDSFPVHSFRELLRSVKISSRENLYSEKWNTFLQNAVGRANAFIKNADFCNLTSVIKILEITPRNSHIHLGNSGTIRYTQLQAARSDLSFYSNRGTSGIDGSLSTAVGAAMVSSELHLMIMGDLSFVYDSNALWNREFPENLKIIVINDQGGGIFRLLDGPDKMSFFEKFSVAAHPVSLKLLAESFGLIHSKAADYKELETQLEVLFSADSKLQLLEVDTSKSENSSIFKQFFKSIQHQ